MKRLFLILLISLFWFGPIYGEEYAIIKESLFGTQKIEIYKTLDEALENYTGEGTVYSITRKKIAVKQVETKKKIEVTEYKWIIEKNEEKNGKKKGK
jgi:glucokinase